MKNLLYSLIGATLFVLSACEKDDDCTPGSLETVIVGEWKVSALGIQTGEVKFNANGTLEDPDDALVGGEIGGVTLDEKTYVVVSNDLFTAKAAHGGSSLEFDFPVTSYSCDEIVFDASGFEAKLSRK